MDITKNEKGSQVFIDNVDILLTDKIVKHTQDNAEKTSLGQSAERVFDPGTIEREPLMKKGNLLFKILPIVALVIIGAVIFFVCKEKLCCCEKK